MRPSSASASSLAAREFCFTPADFDRVRHLIHARAGISLSDQKQEMVYSRLARRLRALKLKSFRDYLEQLEHGRSDMEWDEFINSLTTNLTAFFREAHHFQILAQHLPLWSAKRRVRIWCTAASTGEEPYSLAMTLVESSTSWTPAAAVIATDLDTNVLGIAKRGVYPLQRLDKMCLGRRRRFFIEDQRADAVSVSVRPELRALLTFERLNLLDPTWRVDGPFDAIFCRNVLIYFDKRAQRRIIERFRPLLHPDGLLFVGHSEGLYYCNDLFRSLGRTVYAPVSRSAHGLSALRAR